MVTMVTDDVVTMVKGLQGMSVLLWLQLSPASRGASVLTQPGTLGLSIIHEERE